MPLLDCETRPSSPSICSGKVGVFVSDQNIPVIEIRDLHKAYGDLEVLKGIDITAKRGDVVALIGSSGSGKSTLLRCCNMLEISQEGAIIFQGEAVRWSSADHNRRPADPTQVTRLRTNLSMVFQQFNLWAHMTILQNVMEAPVTVLKQDKAEVEARARKLLVTHDMAMARDVANHVIFLHQGVIEEQGPPETLFGAPKSQRLQQFLSAVA